MPVQIVKLLGSPVQITPTIKGAYSAIVTYVYGDLVSYNGSSYVAIGNTLNNLPTNATYWTQVASKGDTGATGSTGSTGATGATGAGVPTGGTTGQVLAKNSNTDYDDHWIDPPAGGGGSSTPKLTFYDNFGAASFSDYSKPVSGTGAAVTAHAAGTGGFYTATGTTSGGKAEIQGLSDNVFYQMPVYDKNVIFYFNGWSRIKGAASTAFHYIGLDQAATNGAVTGAKSIGFIIKNNNGTGEVYSYHRDGTNAEVQTLLTGGYAACDGSNATFAAVMTSGTNIKFYINGTLYATHTTNLPSGVMTGNGPWCITGWNTAGTTNNSVEVDGIGLMFDAF